MRSTVISSAPTRSVVVKPGAKSGARKGRRTRSDVAIGLVGAVILIASIALFYTLPEDDEVLPQFEVRVANVQYNFTSTNAQVTEGDAYTETFHVPVDNVFFMSLDIGFGDDHVTSEPDIWEVAVLDPLGNVEHRVIVENDVATFDDQTIEWEPQYFSASFSVDLSPPPLDAFVAGESEETTTDDIAAQFTKDNFRPTKGNWTVRLTLQSAGDCQQPGPGMSPEELQRSLTCTSQNTPDVGNDITIELFQYTYFEPRVRAL